MAHFNFVISQNAKWGHAGFYIDRHRTTYLGYSEDGDQPLTETVKNEIETLRPMTAWLKFGALYKTLKVNW